MPSNRDAGRESPFLRRIRANRVPLYSGTSDGRIVDYTAVYNALCADRCDGLSHGVDIGHG